MSSPQNEKRTSNAAGAVYAVERVYLGKYPATEAIRKIIRAKAEQRRKNN